MAILARCPHIPKFLLLTFFILSIIRRFVYWLLQKLGLGLGLGLGAFTDSSEEEINTAQPYHPTHHFTSESHSSVAASSDLIRKILPVVKFENLVHDNNTHQDGCAVCLCEFEGQDEIRPLMDCRHIFHRSCLDGWMDHDQRTCPLCRTPFVPIEMQKAFKEANLTSAADDDSHSHSQSES